MKEQARKKISIQKRDLRKVYPTTYAKMDKICQMLESTPSYRNFRNIHAQIKFYIPFLPESIKKLEDWNYAYPPNSLPYKNHFEVRCRNQKIVKAIINILKTHKIKFKKVDTSGFFISVYLDYPKEEKEAAPQNNKRFKEAVELRKRREIDKKKVTKELSYIISNNLHYSHGINKRYASQLAKKYAKKIIEEVTNV